MTTTSPTTIQFTELPRELSSTILSQYCDGLTLSSALIAFVSSTTHREFGWTTIINALHDRSQSLSNSGMLPPVEQSIQSKNYNLSQILLTPPPTTVLPQPSSVVSSSSSHINNNIATTNNTQLPSSPCFSSSISHLSQRLAILHFFENPHNQIRTDDGIEYPLWCGTLPISFPHHHPSSSPSQILTANVVATAPHTTWHPLFLTEFKKMNPPPRRRHGRRPPLTPTPRRYTPLPPLVRLVGVTPRDRAALSQMARRLNDADEVVSWGWGCRLVDLMSVERERGGMMMMMIPMSVLVLSGKQAERRLRDNLGLRRRPRNMWSLDYVYRKVRCGGGDEGGGERSEVVRVEEGRWKEVEDGEDELFAFMDGPYSSSGDYGNSKKEGDDDDEHEQQRTEVSDLVRNLLEIMRTRESFIINYQQDGRNLVDDLSMLNVNDDERKKKND